MARVGQQVDPPALPSFSPFPDTDTVSPGPAPAACRAQRPPGPRACGDTAWAGRGRGAGWDQQQERVGLPVCCCPSARPAGRCWVTQPVSSGGSRTVREKQGGTGTGVPRPRGDSRDAFRQLPVILGRGPGAFACASETETARQPWAGGQMCLSCLGALAHAAPSAAVPRPPQRAPVHSPALQPPLSPPVPSSTLDPPPCQPGHRDGWGGCKDPTWLPLGLSGHRPGVGLSTQGRGHSPCVSPLQAPKPGLASRFPADPTSSQARAGQGCGS